MTQRERLEKFKGLYQPKEDYTMLVAVSGDDKLMGVIYKKVDIVSTRFKTKDVAETHIAYIKEGDIHEYIKKMEKYIDLRPVKELA
jgi:hypothetical protein